MGFGLELMGPGVCATTTPAGTNGATPTTRRSPPASPGERSRRPAVECPADGFGKGAGARASSGRPAVGSPKLAALCRRAEHGRVGRSANKARFVPALRRLPPGIQAEPLALASALVRTEAVDRNGGVLRRFAR